MAPSAQKREFPILSTVGLVFVLFLVAAFYWFFELHQANKSKDHWGTGLEANYKMATDIQTQCYQGAVFALLLIIALILARGHIIKPMHV